MDFLNVFLYVKYVVEVYPIIHFIQFLFHFSSKFLSQPITSLPISIPRLLIGWDRNLEKKIRNGMKRILGYTFFKNNLLSLSLWSCIFWQSNFMPDMYKTMTYQTGNFITKLTTLEFSFIQNFIKDVEKIHKIFVTN